MWLFIGLLSFLFLLPLVSDQPEEFKFFQGAEKVHVLPSHAVHSGLYCKFGESHLLAGVVQGSACFVGSEIVITGVVEKDLIVIGSNVQITGKVLGNVVVISGQVNVSGQIGGKAILTGVNVDLRPKGEVGRNLLCVAGHGEIDGTVKQGVIAVTGSLDVGGTVLKTLKVFSGQVIVDSTAVIEGDFHYRSQQPAQIHPGSKIVGQIRYVPSFLEDIKNSSLVKNATIGSQIAAKVMNFLYTFVVGIILIRFYPKKLRSVLTRLERHPISSFFWGIGIVILIPLISIVLLVTVVGVPFALTLLALNIVGFYTAKIIPILYFSNKLFSRFGWQQNKVLTLFLGQLLYYSFGLIPVFGWFLSVGTMLFGLGASISAHLHRD